MVDFRSGYVPPGVYVSADTSAVASAVGATPTVICLVGPGLGYQTYIDHIIFANTTDSQLLTQNGINQNSIVVTSTDAGVTTTYDLTDDYTLTATDSSAPDSATTIAIVSSGSIVPGTQIDIAYRYADNNYYGLNQFSDFTSFTNVYGTPFNPSTGAIQSPISLAAQIAFENGANVIYGIAPNNLGSLSDQYRAAYDLSANNYDINLMVPVWPLGTTAGYPVDLNSVSPYVSGLVSHLNDADSAGFPRNAIVGLSDSFDKTVTPDQVSTLFDFRRVVLVWPNRLNYYNSILNTTQVIGGQYLAAAAAGILANNITAQGLTRRQVYSLASIAADIVQQQTTANKNSWSSRGVCVLEANRQSQLVFRHGVTTDPTSVTSREFSIVRCQDELFNEVQQSLESAQLIGTPITANTPLNVKSIIAGALETALSNSTIQGYTGLAVRQQALPNGDPTVIECVFAYQPTYPLNYITVSFTFDLSTGDITTSTDTAADAGSSSSTDSSSS